MNSGKEYEVLEVGVMRPEQVKVDVLRAVRWALFLLLLRRWMMHAWVILLH